MTPQIRILTEADAAELFRLRRSALLDSPLSFSASPEDDAASSEAAVRDLLRASRDSIVFGAFATELVGMLGFIRSSKRKSAHKVQLWGMFVSPACRQHGVGARLLDAAVRHARSEGAACVQLSVNEFATGAQRMYERAGFVTWGVEPDALRFEGSSTSERHMWLPLRAET